ncbi:hypothetical protein EMIT0P395_20171 [Pseudomonas sp. IT-P395]
MTYTLLLPFGRYQAEAAAQRKNCCPESCDQLLLSSGRRGWSCRSPLRGLSCLRPFRGFN